MKKEFIEKIGAIINSKVLSLQDLIKRNRFRSGDYFGFPHDICSGEDGYEICCALFGKNNCTCRRSFLSQKNSDHMHHIFIYNLMSDIQITEDNYIHEIKYVLDCTKVEPFAKIHKDEKFAIFVSYEYDETDSGFWSPVDSVTKFIGVCVFDKEKSIQDNKITWKIVSDELIIDNNDVLSKNFDWLPEKDFMETAVYKKAEAGETEYMFKVAECYLYGLEIEQNIKKAYTWLEEASNKNYIPALCLLGERELFNSNYLCSIKYYERAAELNDAEAAYKLGTIYENPDYCETDYDKALAYYVKSLNLGLQKAKSKVEKLRPLVEKNSLIGKAENGDAVAQFELAFKFLQGQESFEQSEKIALGWLEKAAENNYSEAQYFLSCCYNIGIGVEKDSIKDRYWLSRAAENGHVKAMTTFANILIEEGNPTEGLQYLNAAVEAKYPVAIFYMGFCYYKDKAVEQDINKAIAMFEESYKLGETRGAFYLGEIYETVTKDLNKAIEWYQKAADADIKAAKEKVIELETKQNSNL